MPMTQDEGKRRSNIEIADRMIAEFILWDIKRTAEHPSIIELMTKGGTVTFPKLRMKEKKE